MLLHRRRNSLTDSPTTSASVHGSPEVL